MTTNPSQRKVTMSVIAISFVVMFLLPAAVAKFSTECAGMALCMLLFFIVNPAYFVITGIISGRNFQQRWYLPVISALLFLAGTWTFFDATELWFIAYAAVYLILSFIAAAITHLSLRKTA